MAEIRAGQLQEDLLALSALGEEVERLVLADLPPGVLTRIREATRVAWLPQRETNEPLLRAIRTRAGDEGLRAWARAAALQTSKGRLFGPIIEPLVRMFGLRTESLLRVATTAYRATFRGMGELTLLASSPHVARFALRGLPPEVERELLFLVVAGALESIVAYTGEVGRSEIVPCDDGADACFELRWPVERPVSARPGAGAPPGAARPR